MVALLSSPFGSSDADTLLSLPYSQGLSPAELTYQQAVATSDQARAAYYAANRTLELCRQVLPFGVQLVEVRGHVAELMRQHLAAVQARRAAYDGVLAERHMMVAPLAAAA